MISWAVTKMYFTLHSLTLINKGSAQYWGQGVILLETPTHYTNIYSLYKKGRKKGEGGMERGKEGGNVFFTITFSLERNMKLTILSQQSLSV